MIFCVLFFTFSRDDFFFAPLSDLISPDLSNTAQKGNPGSILAYSRFGQSTVTGLIGAFFIPFFSDYDI